MQILVYIIVAAAGAFLGFLAAACLWAGKARKRARKAGKKSRGKMEFSKLVLLLVMSTYFVGVVIGVKVTLIDFSQLGVLLTFIGAPTATAIVFYAWKAKAENIVKIKKANPDVIENPADIANL